MTNASSHPAGSFCWVELGASDQESAKRFYSSLLGWTANDNPMGPNDFYTIFRLNGHDAAAAYTLREQERAQHVPPHWNLYIAVDSADESVDKAARLGGAVLAPAFDVMDVGRMGVIQDPTGAVFCVWQARSHSGLGTKAENGAFCWADLSTPDPQRGGKFYSDLFGWKLEKSENDPSGYLHIKNGDHFIGGIPSAQQRDQHAPPHWLIYFTIADVPAATVKARTMGAKVLLAPQSLSGVGTWSILADSQGAVFALFKSGR